MTTVTVLNALHSLAPSTTIDALIDQVLDLGSDCSTLDDLLTEWRISWEVISDIYDPDTNDLCQVFDKLFDII